LLVLARKIVRSLSFANMIQYVQRLSLCVEDFACTALKTPSSVRCLNHMGLVFFGNRREPDHLPRFHAKNMTNKIVFVQSLHNQMIRPLLLSFSRLYKV